MKSQTLVLPPILGCLKSVEEYLAKNHPESVKVSWTPTSDIQKEFAGRFLTWETGICNISDILHSISHHDPKVINAWLKEKGYDIRLREDGNDSFCVASVMDMLMEWVEPGKETTVTRDGKNYPAVSLNKDSDAYVINGDGKTEVLKVPAKGGETVIMWMIDKEPVGPLGIADIVARMPSNLSKDDSYSKFVFPMIDINDTPDISWLCGMRTGEHAGAWYISQAVQQTRFRMNERGARAQSAAAMMMSRGLTLNSKTFVIDRPFMLLVERPDVDIPLFAGVFAEDSWKKPADIYDGKPPRKDVHLGYTIGHHIAELDRLGLIE